MCALVLSQLELLDYINRVLDDLPPSSSAPLQRVLHAAVRHANDLKTPDHVTSTLVDLHWLPIKQRVVGLYKLCCHVRNVSIGHAPFLTVRYAECLCQRRIVSQAADVVQRRLHHTEEAEAW